MCGQSSTEGDRKREYRAKIEKEKQKMLNGQMSDNRPPELESELEPETELKTEQKKYGEFKNVLLSDTEYNELIKRLGNTCTQDYVTRLDTYMESKGKQYNNHFATIISWYAMDEKNKNPSSTLDNLQKLFNEELE